MNWLRRLFRRRPKQPVVCYYPDCPEGRGEHCWRLYYTWDDTCRRKVWGISDVPSLQTRGEDHGPSD